MEPARSPGSDAVLVVGVDPRHVPGSWDPEPVVRAIEDAMTRLRDEGFTPTTCLVGLDGSDDVVEVVTGVLTTQSWDCVVVGGGLRHDADLLETFELVVNLVHRHAPDAAIAFSARPDDLPEAVRRARGLLRHGTPPSEPRDAPGVP